MPFEIQSININIKLFARYGLGRDMTPAHLKKKNEKKPDKQKDGGLHAVEHVWLHYYQLVRLIWGQSIAAGAFMTPEFLLAWLAGWKSMGWANNSGCCVD